MAVSNHLSGLFFIFLTSVFTSSAVFAEWLNLSQHRVSDSEYYLDTESVKQTGPMAIYRQVNVLHQGPTATDKAILSKLYLYEYDCMNEKFRILKATGYSHTWAKGEEFELLSSTPVGKDWRELPVGNLGQITFDFLCPSG
jgi:hypothetical protein